MLIMTEGSLQKTEKPAEVHRTTIIKFMFKKLNSILLHSPFSLQTFTEPWANGAKSPKDVEW